MPATPTRPARGRTIVEIARHEGEALVAAAEVLRSAGLDEPEVSVGSTPTAAAVMGVAGVTECRPGNYVFHDASQVALGTCALEDCALTVVATVVSVPAPGRAVVDAGSKTLSSDPLRPDAGRLRPASRPPQPHRGALGGARPRRGRGRRVLPCRRAGPDPAEPRLRRGQPPRPRPRNERRSRRGDPGDRGSRPGQVERARASGGAAQTPRSRARVLVAREEIAVQAEAAAFPRGAQGSEDRCTSRVRAAPR